MPVLTDSPSPDSYEAGLQGVHESIRNYYTGTIRAHGATPRGVDWESLATQQLRFVQLLKICDWRAPLSLNDLGCGYGALLTLIAERYPATAVDYLGIDLSPAMVAAAKRRWQARKSTAFEVASQGTRIADYSVASGIFNVRLDQPLETWRHYVRATLQQLHATSRAGFAVNFLAYSAAAESGFAPELFATDAHEWAAFCRARFGANVEIINSYGMREFTLLVRRE